MCKHRAQASRTITELTHGTTRLGPTCLVHQDSHSICSSEAEEKSRAGVNVCAALPPYLEQVFYLFHLHFATCLMAAFNSLFL